MSSLPARGDGAAGRPDKPGPSSVGGRRITGDILVQLGGRALNLGLGVAVTVIIVRALGDRRFGQWSTLLSVMMIVGYLGNLGLEQVALRQAAMDRKAEGMWLGTLATLRLALSAPVALATAAVVLLISNDGDMRVAGLVLTTMVLFGVSAAAAAVFKLRVRNDINTAIEIANGVLWGAAVVVIAASHGGIVAFALAFALANAVTGTLQIVLALRTIRPRLRGTRRFWATLARVGLPVGISGLLIVAYGRIDQVIVFRIAGDEAAGLYGAAYRVLERAEFVPGAIMTTLYPIIAAAHATTPRRVRELLQQALDALTLITLPLLAFTIVAAAPTIHVLFGDQFAAAAPALPILMFAFVLVAYNYLAGYMIIVYELQRRFVVYAVLALVFNVGLNLMLVPRYGFLAAAWLTAATELLIFVLAMRDVLARAELRPTVGRMARIVVAAAVTGGAVWGVRQAGAFYLALPLTAAVVYPAAVLALRAARREEIVALLARRKS